MVQEVLHVSLGILIIIFGVGIPILFRNVVEYKRELQLLFTTALIAILLYFMMISTGNYHFAMLYYGLYFGMLEWGLIRMFDYTIEYTNIHIYPYWLCKLIRLLTIVDSSMLVLNTFIRTTFQLDRCFYKNTDMVYWSITLYPPFLFHLFICYFIVLLIMILFIKKIKYSPKAYWKIYSNILFHFMLIIIVNVWFYVKNFYFNYSVYIYPILAYSIFYNTYYSVPKGLREDTLIHIVEDFQSAIFCFDANGRCRYMNKKARTMFGIIDKKFYIHVEKLQKKWVKKQKLWKENSKVFPDVIIKIFEKNRHFKIEYQRLFDKKNRTIGYFYKLEDCTDELVLYKKEEYLATHDSLTGLYTREYFFEQVEKIIREDPLTPRYLVCTDIKNFKLVNELFGEKMGDTVLKKQAEALQMANYEKCIHGRIASDRYAMLIPKEHFHPELAKKNTLGLQNLLSKYNYRLKILIGVYEIKDVRESAKVMYDKANLALKQIQDNYEQMIAFYDDTIMEKLVREKDILNSFDKALQNKEICMFLQPQVDQNGKVIGCEAFARWNHPDKGILEPKRFMDVLEKTGAVTKLDQYIWEEAAKKIAQWKDSGKEIIPVSVNLSPQDFIIFDLCQHFAGLAAKYTIPTSSLKLEITEKLFMSDIERNMGIIKKLQELGFSVEIDDFGRGFSSLNLLKDINIDRLKIDMVFLHESMYEERRKIILESICEMAKSMNMPLIMEGVENEMQFRHLKKLDCEFFQGGYFSLPLPVDEFEEKYL